MPVRSFATLLMLPSLLAGCAPELPPLAVATPSAGSAQARHADIRRQLAARCPAPLTPAELDLAAAYVEAHPNDPATLALVNWLDRFDQESRICRSGKA